MTKYPEGVRPVWNRRLRPEPPGQMLRGLPQDTARHAMAYAILRLKGIRAREAVEKKRDPIRSPLDYAMRHRRIDGRPFSLKNYGPLLPLYQDTDSRSMAVMKPSQRGVSEFAITKTLWILEEGVNVFDLEKAGLNVLYVFPTTVALRDFSKERVTGLRQESDHLARIFEDSPYDDLGFKQIGPSYLYLRGGQSEAGLLSLSADGVVLDEYDKIPEESRELADKRMNASLLKLRLDVSTPTLPGIGIHARFLESDQHIYVQQCPNCRADNQYDFFRDVTVDGERYDRWQFFDPQAIRKADVALTCPSCELALDRTARCSEGVYVPQQPDVIGLRGYHVPALAWPFVDLMELAVKAVNKNPSALEQFMRQDLGVPYHSKGSGITEEMVVQLALDLPNGQLPPGPWERPTMGVDVGGRFHVKITAAKRGEEKRYCLFMQTVDTWGQVEDLMTRYRVAMAVVDAYPEAHGARAFVSKFKGRACIADYPTNMGALRGNLIAPESQKAVQDGFVRVNRTMALDMVMANVSGASEHWPQSVVDDEEVRSNMTGMARVTSLDSRGQVVASWTRLRADHYFHASVYELVARQLTPKFLRTGRIASSSAKTQMASGTNYRRVR